MKEYHWDVNNRLRMGQYLTAVETDFLGQFLQHEVHIHSILDVGGGSGRFAIPLEQKGYKVTVVEVQPLPLHWLKLRSPGTNGLVIGREAGQWPIRGASVDCILAIEVPIVEFPWFWRESHRVLKPGGVVITCITNSQSYKGVLYKIRPMLRPFLPQQGKQWADRKDVYNLTPRMIAHLLEEYHFQQEQVLGFNWLPQGRNSNFYLIPMLGTLERQLGLASLADQSPWIMIKARAC